MCAHIRGASRRRVCFAHRRPCVRGDTRRSQPAAEERGHHGSALQELGIFQSGDCFVRDASTIDVAVVATELPVGLDGRRAAGQRSQGGECSNAGSDRRDPLGRLRVVGFLGARTTRPPASADSTTALWPRMPSRAHQPARSTIDSGRQLRARLLLSRRGKWRFARRQGNRKECKHERSGRRRTKTQKSAQCNHTLRL
jgi:hypothetical protein